MILKSDDSQKFISKNHSQVRVVIWANLRVFLGTYRRGHVRKAKMDAIAQSYRRKLQREHL